jgi:aminodeoxyfutalosine synthase
MIAERILGSELMPIYEKVVAGVRLSESDGRLLYRTPNLTGVGYLANIVRERRHGDKAYYVRNQHINYTNICNKLCRFCSFYAKKGGPAPYTLTPEQVKQRLRQYLHVPITEVHIVGGIHPKLPFQYYLDLLQAVKEVRPEVHIKAFTAVEIVQIAQVARMSYEDTLRTLKSAGLDSLPGGGLEIYSERIHQELFPRKIGGDEWSEVARAAARVGLNQYATMLYGHIETIEERVEHLMRLRELQDETGHFLALTPLSFHPEGTDLEHLPHPSGYDDLRNIAVSRLMLDNFPHIKSFWVMNTPAVTQVALWYGADDVDGTVHEYEIVYQDDSPGERQQVLTRHQLIDMILEAGRIPVERDSHYNEVPPRREEELSSPVLTSAAGGALQ